MRRLTPKYIALFLVLLLSGLFLTIVGCQNGPSRPNPGQTVSTPRAVYTPSSGSSSNQARYTGVMLGIDVLEASNFRQLSGKRIALLTHPAGVNRNGRTTLDILHRATNVRLIKLFAPEHSTSGTVKASQTFDDYIDSATRLPVHSLYGKNRKPTKVQLANIDAVVVDLQDIGARSYTYSVTTKNIIEACFENNVEVIILDRPNPLGGYKVDGPMLDPDLRSGVGAYCMPYIHGLTMGELALMAVDQPNRLNIPDSVRKKGKLTVIPMQGWKRSMTWPDTGLRYVTTSPIITSYNAVIAYAMLGLGCEYSGFKYGVRAEYPYFSITHAGASPDRLLQDLRALKIPGLSFQKITTNVNGKSRTAVYIAITDFNAWNPTELSFHMMVLACRYSPPNPYVKLPEDKVRLYNIHVGSMAWWNSLRQYGVNTPVRSYLTAWKSQSQNFQAGTKKYWLYY